MLTKQTLTIASANLFNFIEPPNAFYDFENIYERDAWQDKCRWTTEQIQALAADVIGLQEVFSIEATQALFAQMGYPFFATVETPKVADEYIYSHPVVAIASRYPLKHIQAVTTPNDLISEGYGVEAPPFSRSPVFCIVDVPHIGELGFYVCHLKSQRAAESLIPDKAQPLIGRWLSSQQRGWEALMLRLFSEQQYAQHPMPTVLVGDMNQALSSDISGLLTQPANNEPHKLQFKDSWQLLLDTTQDRPATHYHFSRGHVLDYILLSQEFQPDSVYSLADVTQFTTLDDHLINPSYEQDKNASDHAFIAVTLRFVL